MFQSGQELPNSRSSGPTPVAPTPSVSNVAPPSPLAIQGRDFLMSAFAAGDSKFPVPTISITSGQPLHPPQSPVQSPQPSLFIPPLPGSPPVEVPSPPLARQLPSSPSPRPHGEGLDQSDVSLDQPIVLPLRMPNDPEMVKNIEVLASSVVKNGPEFELIARAKQAGDPKFAFLFEGDSGTEAAVGHEYYKWKKRLIGLQIHREVESRVGERSGSVKASESSQQVNRIRGKCIGIEEVPGSPTVSDMDMEDGFVMESPKKGSFGRLVHPKAESFPTGGNRDSEQSPTLPISQKTSENGSPSNCHFPSENVLDISLDIDSDKESSASEQEFDDKLNDGANSGNCHEDAQDVQAETGLVMEDISPENSWSSSERQLKASTDGIAMDIEESMTDKMGEGVSRDFEQGMTSSVEGTREPSARIVSDRDDTAQIGQDGQAEGTSSSHDNGLSRIDHSSRDWEPLSAVNKVNETGYGSVSCRPDTYQRVGVVAVDEFGRIKCEGSDESDFDDDKLLSRRKKRSNSRSRSRSWSPAGDSGWRRQSGNHSPHRWGRHSRSRSRSPRWRGSCSRTPPRDSNSRWGGSGRSDRDFYEKGRTGGRVVGMNVCFNFAKGKCFRGASCRYLHQEISGGTNDGVDRRFLANRNREWRDTSIDYQKSWETRGAISSGVLAVEANSPKKVLEDAPEFEAGSELKQGCLTAQGEIRGVVSQFNEDEIEKPANSEKNDMEERNIIEVVEVHARHSSPLSLSLENEYPLQDPLSEGQLLPLYHPSAIITSISSLSSIAPQASLSSIQQSVSVGQHIPSGYSAQLSMPKVHPVPQGNPAINFQYSLPMHQSVPMGTSIHYQPTAICQTMAIHQPTSIHERTSIYQPFPFENLQSFQQTNQPFPVGNPNFNQQVTFSGSNFPPMPPPATNQTLALQPGYGVPLPPPPPLPLPPPVIVASPVTTQQSSFPITSQTPIFLGNQPFAPQPGIIPPLTTTSPLQHGFIPTSVISAPPSFPHPFIGHTSNQFTFPNLVKGGGSQNCVLTRLPITVPPMSQIPAQGGMPWMAVGSLCSQTALVQSVLPQRPAQLPTFTYRSPGLSSGLPPVYPKPALVNSESGEQYDPLADSIEPEASGDFYAWNKPLMLNYDPHTSIFPGGQPIDVSRLLDISPNVPALTLENVSPGFSNDHTEVMNFQVNAMGLQLPLVGFLENPDPQTVVVDEIATTGVGVVENVSPLDENRIWSFGQPLEGATGMGEVETGQEQVQLDLKKPKEDRGLKLLRSAVAEYVKEELRPTWRDGHMSKEAFKAIAKKAVDKVTGTLPSHHIPKSQEKVDQYMALSKTKISKLVQSYVDKFLKA